MSVAAGPNSKGRHLLLWAIGLIVVVLLLRLVFGHHENRYEKLANEVTVAIQNNDLAGVQKYQNAETATEVNRGIVGRLSDELAPLGKLERVKEATPANVPSRGHEFDLTFAKGTAHEDLRVDPDGKIVEFHVDRITPKS
jgi:hypothetical protein